MKRMAIYICCGLIAAVMWVGTGAAQGPAAVANPLAGKGPKAVFPEKIYNFKPVTEGFKITHDFLIENQGDAPLVIKNIRPD